MTKIQSAILAAGCFWHVQEIFSKIQGVIKTTVGYTGGTTNNPSYKQVSSGKTGHTESILIDFDPEKISYKELLEIFWKMHDPTSLNKQGSDTGTNYRSAIFYYNKNQKKNNQKNQKNKLKRILINKL
jgi:methionine-S-sulfoxide reductase